MKKDFWDEREKIPQAAKIDVTSQGPEKLFNSGLLLLKQNKLWNAWLAFKQAFQIKPDDPRYLSYFGFCMAKVMKNATKALPLCEKAVTQDFYRPELYNNLGQVYLLKRNRKWAHMAFKKGLSLDKHNREIINELKKMGIRKPSVFPFLTRKNVINYLGGKFLSKLGLR